MEKEFIKLSENYWFEFMNILPRLIIAVIVLLIAIYIARKISSQIKKRIIKRLDDQLLANFIARISKWILTLIGVVISMDVMGLGNFAGGLMAGAGASAIIIGFAFKDIGENFLSGVILAFNRPFNVGDVIETQKITGSILALDLRTTTVKTFEGYVVYIPNSVIVNTPLINYNRIGIRRFDFIVGIDYENDVDRARKLILDSITGIEELLKDPPPMVIINELSSHSTNLRVFYWINTLETKRNFLEVRSEVIETTVKAFGDGGINIPYDSLQVQFNKGIPEIPVNIVSNGKKENNK